MKLIVLIVGAGLFIFSLIRKPEIIAVVLFTLVIAAIDGFYLRPVLTLVLFGRVLFDKATQASYPSFLKVSYVKLLLLFLLYGLLIALWQDLFDYDLFKGDIDTVILTYCVYHYFFKSKGPDQLKIAMIISGFICFADLAYTYMKYGSFPIHRIYMDMSSSPAEIAYDDMFAGINWNFFGQICGMAFVYVLSDFIRNRQKNKLMIWVLPVMLLGVLMSTSRSAILGLLVISILIILKSINYQEQKRRVIKVAVFGIGIGMVGIFLFSVLGKYLNLDSRFLDEVISRLSDEPIAILKKAMGQPYNIHNMGSMEWREESAENAYAAFMNLDFKEQLFGIGVRGFEVRNIGHGYNAHNATLLLLIENGIIGFVLYFTLVARVLFRSILLKNFSPAFYVVGFIFIYGLGQNREWTGWTTFLFLFCVVAEIQYIRIQRTAEQSSLSIDKPKDITMDLL